MAFKVSKEFQVGLFALLAGAFLYFGFNFLKGTDFLSSNNKYFVVYEDVGGLVISNPVLVNGLAVGRVDDIVLVQGVKPRVVVTMEVDKDVKLYQGTKALLFSQGPLSDKAVRLDIPLPSQNVHPEKDTLPGTAEVALMDQIKQKVDPLITNLDSVTNELKILMRNFRRTSVLIDKTVASTGRATEQASLMVSENRPALRQTTANMAALTASLSTTQRNIDGLLRQFSGIADTIKDARIARTVQDLNRTIGEVNALMADVNAGKGTLGKLTKNDSLYRNLNRSSEDLDALLKDMKDRPGRYIHFSVFGKKQK